MTDIINRKFTLTKDEFEELIASSNKIVDFILNVATFVAKSTLKALSFLPKGASKIVGGLSSIIENNLRIEDYFWNPEAEGYKFDFSKTQEQIIKKSVKTENLLDKYSNKSNRVVPDFLKFKIKILAKVIGTFNNFLEGITDLAESYVQFYITFICGVWNAIIDLITGILFLVKLLFDAIAGVYEGAADFLNDPKYYLQLFAEYIDNMIQAWLKIDWKDIISSIKDGFKDLKNYLPKDILGKIGELNAGELGYYTGYIILNILEFVIPALKLAKAAKAGKLPKFFSEIAEGFVKSGTKVKATGKKILESLVDLWRAFIRLLKKGKDEIKKFIKAFYDKIKKWLLKENKELDWLALGFLRLSDDGNTIRNIQRLAKMPNDGFFEVVGHGTPKRIFVGKIKYKAEDFAKYLFENGYEKGKPIRLIACNTGAKPSGFASQLSKILNVEILAPNTKIAITDELKYAFEKGGKFLTFKP